MYYLDCLGCVDSFSYKTFRLISGGIVIICMWFVLGRVAHPFPPFALRSKDLCSSNKMNGVKFDSRCDLERTTAAATATTTGLRVV